MPTIAFGAFSGWMSMVKFQSLADIGRAHIRTVLRRARLILLWERIWPVVFSLLMIACLYAGLSWMGLWLLLPTSMKIVGIVFFVLAVLWALRPIFHLALPQEHEAVARVEAVSGVMHRPLSASLDVPAGDMRDPVSPQALLWRAHQQRLTEGLSRLRAGWPLPLVERRDPFALRAVIVLVAFIGFSVAGADWSHRLRDIFDFSAAKATVVARADAWVTPPRYTGKAPIFLTRDAREASEGAFVVPQGSLVTIRTVNSSASVVTFEGAGGQIVAIAAKTPADGAPPAESARSSDFEFELRESGALKLSGAGNDHRWAFDVIADDAPQIAFINTPEVQRSGALQVIASFKDDYGVVQAEALFEAVGVEASDAVRPLYEAPKFPLSLSRGKVKEGTSKTLRSLVEHPWAGGDVTMRLRAVDEAGLEGRSETLALKLPSRRFVNPLARAIIEQRLRLAMNGNYVSQLVDVIDVLTIRPERFEDQFGALIALAAVRRGLLDARNDDALRAIVDDLWDLAIGLEDGDLSDAERALRDALEALREGIKNGASEEELARLMKEAREALDEFMQALAEQAQRNADTAQNQPPIDPSQVMNPEDLQKMLDRVQELAQTGSRDAAEQLLSELQQMMENLQANRQQGERGENQAQQMLNELGEMIRRQQQLMDDTFREQRQGPGQQQGQQQGQQGEQNGQQPGQSQGRESGREPGGQGQGEPRPGSGGRGLEQDQNQLADRLQQFIDRLGQGESDPSGKLGEAQRSMRDAAGQLGQGNLGPAGDQQAQALDDLRSGAQALAEQMAGEGEGEGDHDLAKGDRGTDPLGRRDGRRNADFGDDVEVPDEIDTQRAREILEAIRKRLGETVRPQIELDYLERLLRSE